MHSDRNKSHPLQAKPGYGFPQNSLDTCSLACSCTLSGQLSIYGDIVLIVHDNNNFKFNDLNNLLVNPHKDYTWFHIGYHSWKGIAPVTSAPLVSELEIFRRNTGEGNSSCLP